VYIYIYTHTHIYTLYAHVLTCLSAAARQSDWDGIVACHRGRLATTTWSFQRCTMGVHHLTPPAAHGTAIATVTDRFTPLFLWSSSPNVLSVVTWLPVSAQAVDVTSCGNFAVIGSSCGRVDVYNLQSGQHRGCYGSDGKGAFTCSLLWLVNAASPVTNSSPSAPAHGGAVRGVATDTLNQLTLTAGSDWLLKFWRFKSRKQEAQLKLHAAPASMILHRDR